MANNNQEQQQGMKINLSPEAAKGTYVNLAVIAHSPSEFVLDMILAAPNAPANVQTRLIMTPDNAKNLLAALQQNIANYEATFGEIKQKTPAQNNPQNNGGILNWPGGGKA